MENPEGNFSVHFTEMQGNSQDFLLQDYNVKKVKEEKLDKLEKFNLSGPEYEGISEIIADQDAVDAATTEDTPKEVVVCLSTYHSQSGTESTPEKQDWIPKSPNYSGDVWVALKDLDFTSKISNVSTEKDVCTLLSAAYERCKGGAVAGSAITQDMIDEIHKVIGVDNRSGLRGEKKVAAGYSYQKEAYPIENAIADKIASGLEQNSYSVVKTKSTVQDAGSFIEKAKEAAVAQADLHIIVWSRQSVDEGNGWFTAYRDVGEYVVDSQKLAEKLASALGELCDVEAAILLGYTSTTEKFGEPEYYACLNWAECPTVLLVVGSYADVDMKAKLESAMVQNQFSEAVQKAVSEVFPSES